MSEAPHIPPIIAAKAAEAKIRRSKKSTPPSTVDLVQLPIWAESVRSAPNELLRCALFSAKNRKQPRAHLKNASIAIIGDGKITYTGEELRQDDETVWLQLIHLARVQPLGALVEFQPAAFCREIGWPRTGQSYTRLRESITRLQANALGVVSERLGEGVSLSMIPFFAWRDEASGEALALWRVRVAPELVRLFGDVHFSRLEWQQRLALPDGVATWLHGYLASHADPFPIKIETIARGAGLLTTEIRELRRMIKTALMALIAVGFLVSGKLEDDLLYVKRASIKQ